MIDYGILRLIVSDADIRELSRLGQYFCEAGVDSQHHLLVGTGVLVSAATW